MSTRSPPATSNGTTTKPSPARSRRNLGTASPCGSRERTGSGTRCRRCRPRQEENSATRRRPLRSGFGFCTMSGYSLSSRRSFLARSPPGKWWRKTRRFGAPFLRFSRRRSRPLMSPRVQARPSNSSLRSAVNSPTSGTGFVRRRRSHRKNRFGISGRGRRSDGSAGEGAAPDADAARWCFWLARRKHKAGHYHHDYDADIGTG